MNYPKTYEAAKKAEKGQWAIGDALIVEVGPPDSSDRAQAKRFEQAARELTEAGMPYAASTLRRLRDISAKFEAGRRRPDVAPEVAKAAGTPQVLADHEATGKPMTVREVAKTRKATTKAKKKQKATPTGTGQPTKAQVSRERKSMEFETLAIEAARNADRAMKMLTGWDAEEAEELKFLALEAANQWQKVANSLTGRKSSDRLVAIGGGR